MATITKKDLVDRIAASGECKRAEVKKVIQSFLDQMISELGRGNRIEFRDFGVFEVKARAARIAQNPKTLQRVSVPAKRTVKFKVGRLMKDQLEGPDHHAEGTSNGSGDAGGSGGGGGGGGGDKHKVVLSPNISPTGKMPAKKPARN